MSPSDTVLTIRSLTKRYRQTLAIDNIDLTIEPGEFVGFIGPNGAGKSSTMGCIAGTIAPDSGTVEIRSVDVEKDPVAARMNMGFVPQHLTLLDYLTGLEYLHFVADLRELSISDRDAQIDELLEITELQDARDSIIGEFSGGMVRKLAIASALLASPPLLVLDESFVGLDPESTYRLRVRLERHCHNGGAILLSSHILDMLESLCSRFIIIHDGKIIRDLPSQKVDNLTELYLQATGKAKTLP